MSTQLQTIRYCSNSNEVEKLCFQDELIDNVVLTQLSHIESDVDLEVRKHAATLLIDLVESCRTHRCLDVIDLLHKVSVIKINVRFN